MRKRLHLFVSGRVQGVYYRASARDAARQFGLTGWVRNLPDGRVEALFEGDEEALRRMREWCGTGPPGSRPRDLQESWLEDRGEFQTFEIRYGNSD